MKENRIVPAVDVASPIDEIIDAIDEDLSRGVFTPEEEREIADLPMDIAEQKYGMRQPVITPEDTKWLRNTSQPEPGKEQTIFTPKGILPGHIDP